VTGDRDRVLLTHVDEMARLDGCLLRRLDPDSSAWFLADRLGDHIESLDAMIGITAAEVAVECFRVCGDWEVAVDEALRIRDDRTRHVRMLLGREKR
jgi:hypothetical protein